MNCVNARVVERVLEDQPDAFFGCACGGVSRLTLMQGEAGRQPDLRWNTVVSCPLCGAAMERHGAPYASLVKENRLVRRLDCAGSIHVRSPL